MLKGEWGSEYRLIQGLGFRVWGSEYRVWSLSLGFMVWSGGVNKGFRIQGSE